MYQGDCHAQSETIERFWTVLNEIFDDDQIKLFLIFVWGRNTLPNRDEDFISKFVFHSFYLYDGEQVRSNAST